MELKKNLIEAMGEMSNPVKTENVNFTSKRTGQVTKYDYETLESVLNIVLPPLRKRGIGLTQGLFLEGEQLTLKTIVFDDESEMVLDLRPVQRFTDPQDMGSYETYMRRYALRTAFALAAVDDDAQSLHQKLEVVKEEPKKQKDDEDLKRSKQRLWTAVKKYAELHNADPNALLEGIKKRSDYKDKSTFYDFVSIEFEEAINADQ